MKRSAHSSRHAVSPSLAIHPQKPRRELTRAALILASRQLATRIRLASHWWLSRHTPYQALFVLSTQRSGSSLLLDYLNSLPGVGMRGEILSPTKVDGASLRWSGARAIKHLRHCLHTQKTAVRGGKIMLDHLVNHQLTPEILDDAFGGAKFIVIYRQSMAEQFLSRKTAVATRQWAVTAGQERKLAKVHLPPGELLEYCDRVRRAYEHVLAWPGMREKASVLSYEELSADPAGLFANHVCPLIGVPPAKLKTGLLKQNVLPLVERIENYAEVADLFTSPRCRQHHTLASPAATLRRAA